MIGVSVVPFGPSHAEITHGSHLDSFPVTVYPPQLAELSESQLPYGRAPPNMLNSIVPKTSCATSQFEVGIPQPQGHGDLYLYSIWRFCSWAGVEVQAAQDLKLVNPPLARSR